MTTLLGTGGIMNVGFTCYANAVIQAFRHCSNMDTLFQEDNFNKILKKDCKYNDITKQFANVIQTLSTITSKSSLRPGGFWNAFTSVAKDSCFEHLIQREPHDAHEFLMFLLDALHESLSRKVTMNITQCILKSEKQILQQKSLEIWKSNFEQQYSPFVNMYFGEFHIQTTCSNCTNVSNNFETFNTLKGVFNEYNTSPTLIQCLQGELNEEIIEEYACDKCAPKRYSAVRKTRIWKLPTTLIIVLKRFTSNGRKIHTSIENINNTIALTSIFSSNSPNKLNSNYSVQSIVDHHGSSTGGHYTAQAKHVKENKWFLYDDQNVHPINNPIYGESTYILFLERVV
jgi:ubiquitin C-terminal hydrolase